MQIYRVQHKTNNHGPYITDNMSIPCLSEILEKNNLEDQVSDPNHPSPLCDPILREIFMYPSKSSLFKFGFESLDSLMEWFYSYPEEIINILKDFDYHIVVYEVEKHTDYGFMEDGNIDSYYIGHNQVIFNKKYAKIVDFIEM